MSMQDPIADMLTRIRNAQARGKARVAMPHSKVKRAIADLLLRQGYIRGIEEGGEGAKAELTVVLKYFEGKPVIAMIKRISRPGVRTYVGKDELPSVQGGLGVAVVSTSQGLMTDREARAAGHGGEVICHVS